jgi:hypothetical protein
MPDVNELARPSGHSQTGGEGEEGLEWLRRQTRAHALVARAVKAGTLTRGPCQVCGAEKTDAHHDDYGKPLEVRWLCRLHHRQEHMQGPRKVQRGVLTVRQLRHRQPEEPVWIATRDAEGLMDIVALWIPAWLVDE